MAEAAARAIMPRYGHLMDHEVREKTVGELVTIADNESESILAAGLAKIIPEAAVVGEEAVSGDPSLLHYLSDALCWIIDPLDGTANFAAGMEPFGILVALAEHGLAIGGWIFDPRSGRFCSALRGEGTKIDGEPVRSKASGDDVPSAAVSSLFTSPQRRAELLSQMEPRFRTVTMPRCAAEQYPRLILGVNDITLYERTLAWDHAAGALCLTEAGGVLTRFDGSPYRVDEDRRGLIAAATPALWEMAFSQLRGD
jgi:fructose-1,6-bisphosphatase/inositol monophosphatase family enzyme